MMPLRLARLKTHIHVILGEMKIIMKQENDDYQIRSAHWGKIGYKGKVPLESQPSSSSLAVKKLRIIVVCGDGTAGWILGVISDLNLDQHGFRYYV
ncbi:hypothetical protein Tco_1166652 [Tanacetum coccineum]